jgi:transposase
VVGVFSRTYTVVLKILGEVYALDKQTKGMGDDERLLYHQQHSLPLMNTLYIWLNQQRDEKRVEPNSPLGRSINYMLKHWHALTQFTRVPGALIDNNHVERALKMPIRTRKMAMFHKTEHGAYVAALLMGLIQTAIDNDANPVEYLTALQENKSRVFKEPQLWLPWNYMVQLQTEDAIRLAA